MVIPGAKLVSIKWCVRKLRKCASGAIAVEFGFIAPVMLMLALGVAEASQAISQQLTVQSAARAGTHYGLTVPPVGGNVQPIVDAVKANLPTDWLDSANPKKASIQATVECECEVSGAIACGATCGVGERSISYLRVAVSKPYQSLVQFREFSTGLTLTTRSQVRLR